MSECICMHHLCTRALSGQKGYWIHSKWSYRQLWAAMWVLGAEPGPLPKTVLLTSKPSLQPQKAHL